MTTFQNDLNLLKLYISTGNESEITRMANVFLPSYMERLVLRLAPDEGHKVRRIIGYVEIIL